MFSARKFVTCVVLICAFSTISSAGTVFNFDAIAPGTLPTFADTVDGLTATFSGGGAVCDISSLGFTLQSGNALITDLCGGSSGSASVAFSSALSSLSMDFVTNSLDTFILDAFLGATLVGSSSASGTILSSFPEGVIEFSGVLFDNVTISTTFAAFSVDNLDATAAPEPGCLALLGSGALALLGLRRRR